MTTTEPLTTAPIAAIVEELRPLLGAWQATLVDVAADLHAHPEIRFTEVHAAARLTGELEQAGFAVTRGFAGLATAFVARWSTAVPQGDAERAPTIAVFCEYDALEGIGHGCGHNVIAAAGLGAGLLVQDALERTPVAANLVVIGSPGEEGAAGKVPMIEAGVLDGVDLAIMVHPSGRNAIDGSSLSRIALDVDFDGRASHAAASPELGINALDAATLSLTAIGLLRQQLTDDVRVHAIIVDGGQAPNIIPEHASLRVFIRAQDREHLLENVVPRVRACFEGAAIATGASVRAAENTPPYFSLVQNPTLVGLAGDAYRALGREPQLNAPAGGSTDMGNVSQVVPAIHPMIELEPGLTAHTREFAAAADGPHAAAAVTDGAAMLAAVALAAFRDPAVVERARAEFAEQFPDR
ncbi:amidohydrolase [Promicromonospora soli]